MLVRDAGHRLGERGRAIDIPGDDLEHGAVHQAIGRGREMVQFRDSRRRRVGDLPGAIDLAERPQSDRQIDGRGNADVLAEAEGEIAIPLRIEDRHGLFEMRARLDIVSGEPLRHAIGAMRHACLGRTGPMTRRRAERPARAQHSRQIAMHVAARPEPVIGRKARVDVGRVRAEFMRALESREGFGRAMAVRGDHRIAVGDLQLQPPPVPSASPTPTSASVISIALPRCAIASL